jgi:hypothetical protein
MMMYDPPPVPSEGKYDTVASVSALSLSPHIRPVDEWRRRGHAE